MQQFRGDDEAGREADPSELERQLDGAVARLTQRLVDARAVVGSMLEGAARLALQARAEEMAAAESEQQATAALEAGDEERARAALHRRRVHAEAARAMSSDLEEHRRVAQQMLEELRAWNDQVEQAKRERSMLLVRLRSAQARQALVDAAPEPTTGPGSVASEPLAAFERIEDQIVRLEARARAGEEVQRTLAGADTRVPGSGVDSGLDQELVDLRLRMGLPEAGAGVARLPAEGVGAQPDEPGTDPEQQAKR